MTGEKVKKCYWNATGEKCPSTHDWYGTIYQCENVEHDEGDPVHFVDMGGWAICWDDEGIDWVEVNHDVPY